MAAEIFRRAPLTGITGLVPVIGAISRPAGLKFRAALPGRSGSRRAQIDAGGSVCAAAGYAGRPARRQPR